MAHKRKRMKSIDQKCVEKIQLLYNCTPQEAWRKHKLRHSLILTRPDFNGRQWDTT
jgi:hypothetical protein